MIQYKLTPWFIAQATKAMFFPLKLNLELTAAYWKTWHEVYRSDRVGSRA